MPISTSDIPDRLKINGREAHNNFTPDERLFPRVKDESFDEEGGIVPSSLIPFPNLSINREKYSNPEDVLIGFDPTEWEICYVTVSAVDSIMTMVESEQYGIMAFHTPIHAPPEQENYAHTDLKVIKGHAPGKIIKNFKTERRKVVKHELKHLLSREFKPI